jgi:hypothetical protein
LASDIPRRDTGPLLGQLQRNIAVRIVNLQPTFPQITCPGIPVPANRESRTAFPKQNSRGHAFQLPSMTPFYGWRVVLRNATNSPFSGARTISLAPHPDPCYSDPAFVALVSPFVLKRRRLQLAAVFLFPTRFTAVSSESAKDARFTSKVVSGKRVHQIAFLFEKEHISERTRYSKVV